MKSAVLSLTVATLLAGCTHTQVIARTASPAAFQAASEATAGRDAEVLTRRGEIFRWYDVQLTPDSTSGVPLATGAAAARPWIPTEQLAQISMRSRGRGALEGSVIGAGIGAILGFIIGPDDYCSFGDVACADSAGEQALWGSASGAVWGVIIGAIRGSRTRIQVR